MEEYGACMEKVNEALMTALEPIMEQAKADAEKAAEEAAAEAEVVAEDLAGQVEELAEEKAASAGAFAQQDMKVEVPDLSEIPTELPSEDEIVAQLEQAQADMKAKAEEAMAM